VKPKFLGDLKTLKRIVALTGIAGQWKQIESHYQYQVYTGAVLNWWPSTGTITFQGRERAADDLKAAIFKFVVVMV
jgi:hypothetical protein